MPLIGGERITENRTGSDGRPEGSRRYEGCTEDQVNKWERRRGNTTTYVQPSTSRHELKRISISLR